MRNSRVILLAMLSSLGAVACSDGGAQTGSGGAGGQAGGGGSAGSAGGRAGGSGGPAGRGGGSAGSGGQAGAAAGTAGAAGGASGQAGGSGSAGSSGGAGAAGTSGAGGATGTGGTGGSGTAGSGGAAGASGAAGAGGRAGSGGATGSGGGAGSGGATGSGGAGGQTGGAGGQAGGAGGQAGGVGGQAGATPPHSLGLVAGGLGGPGNVDGTGVNARFKSPAGMAVDGAGNLFVADSQSSTIRKIVIATGAVTTFAGAPGQSGSQDGTAAARFGYPRSVASDGAGNLFVADNSTIRKIVIATGAVTTLAGSPNGSGTVDGTGANARFVRPSGIVGDGAGNLFVSDATRSDIASHITIRKVVIATGAVTTLATLSGQYYDVPGSLAFDGAGNLFVAYNACISKVTIATGTLTTFAGSPGQTGSVDGMGTAARFARPSGIASDGAGNLFVPDTNTLRKVVIATGAVTTVVDGTGAPLHFDGPGDIAADGAGNLFVADGTMIRKVVIATGAVTTFAGANIALGTADGIGAAARFTRPQGIASDGAGNLFVADTYDYTIRQIVVATGVVSTLAGTPGQAGTQDGIGAAASFTAPNSITSDGAGNLYVTDGIIRKIVIATGAVTTVTNGPGRDPQETGPSGITTDGAGNLYFVQSGEAVWKVVIATGALSPIAGSAGGYGSKDGTGAEASFSGAGGIASDGAGNLFVADTGNATIRKIVIASRAVTTLAGKAGLVGTADGTGATARFNTLGGIASDGAGNLFVADGNTIRKIVISTKTVSTVVGAPGRQGVSLGALPASLGSAWGVAVLPAGDLAITEYAENAVLLGRL
jgi:hypothetical protein